MYRLSIDPLIIGVGIAVVGSKTDWVVMKAGSNPRVGGFLAVCTTGGKGNTISPRLGDLGAFVPLIMVYHSIFSTLGGSPRP